MKIKIFYSWQTSTDRKYNKNFIGNCIEKAVKKIKRKPQFQDIDFEILDGVRGEPGSPSVASKITDERIPSCDIFIADLSVINHISKTKMMVRSIIGDSFKPFQNNNVINEHGVALNAIGVERIIGVLNNEFGSPNKNPENIPFDLRHLSFPIEYNYSPKTKNKEEVQNQLVGFLSSALRKSTIHALIHRKNKNKPLSVWSEWESQTNTAQKFHTNDVIDEITQKIITGIKKPNESIRLIGLSGLGKTRILLETFRINKKNEDSILLNSRILYMNCNHYSAADYQSILGKLVNEGEDRIVILDNCTRTLHRNLLHFINSENNKISLVTVDSNPEEFEQDKINGVNYIVIKKEDFSSIVNDILTQDFAVLGKENVEKIKEFSQGIPLMAVLLGESIKNGEKFVGKLDDKELLNKLLGEKGNHERSRTILKSCSMFNYFGIKDKFKSQLEFIATNKDITSLTGENKVIINEFHEICTHYLKREIFERKGRLIGMRPFPLAMSLAQEWLEPCTSERLLNIITSIANLKEPDRSNLSEAMAEQMKYLGYNDKAILIVKEIVGPQSPFDNAEVLNTELGSRLFRSFVEVNPVAVCKNIVRVFSIKTKEELLEIVAGRRNLVWVLEKLCFDKRTFKDSAKILYSFAVAENETWANNATGQFLQLFKIILAGTEANLNERWDVIDWGLNQNNEEYLELAVKAMKSGLSYGHFSRTGGAERQGSKVLMDYQPKWKEIKEYWTKILTTLTSIAKSNNSFSIIASDSIAYSIRSICNAQLASVILPFVEEISIFKNNDWDEGLKNLRLAKKYEKGLLSTEEQIVIEKLIESLTKTDFQTRYINISSSYYLDNDESYSSDKLKEALTSLADEFIDEKLPWEINFPIFYSNQQVFYFHFGKRIYQKIHEQTKKYNHFIQLSIDTISEITKERRNVTVLIGFISEASEKEKDKFYETLFHNNELNYLLFSFLSNDKNGKIHFPLLFELVDNGNCELSNFNVFSHSYSLENCDFNELLEFSQKMFGYGKDGYSLVFDMFFNLGYNNKELKKSLQPIFKECIYEIGIDKKQINQLEKFQWSDTICNILSFPEETEFAKFINHSIINSISWENLYHFDYDIQKIYVAIIKFHFQAVWSDLSSALMSKDDDYIKFYGLKGILGSHIGGVTRSVGILFDGDIETIFEWCKSNQPLAPARLAELVPIYGENNDNYSIWHPITKRLIDEFGEFEEVLSNLGANMGNFSWVGSVVPLLEGKKELFKALENHKNPKVSIWATKYLTYTEEQIKQEKNRDEEMYL